MDRFPVLVLIKKRKVRWPVLSVPYIRPYFSGTLVCTVHIICVLASHIQLHYRFHSPEAPDSASVPVADIVAAFQIQLFLVLAHIIAEAFGRNRGMLLLSEIASSRFDFAASLMVNS